jgi:hypothetical protein
MRWMLLHSLGQDVLPAGVQNHRSDSAAAVSFEDAGVVGRCREESVSLSASKPCFASLLPLTPPFASGRGSDEKGFDFHHFLVGKVQLAGAHDSLCLTRGVGSDDSSGDGRVAQRPCDSDFSG